MPSVMRILLIDSDPVLRPALSSLLDDLPDFAPAAYPSLDEAMGEHPSLARFDITLLAGAAATDAATAVLSAAGFVGPLLTIGATAGRAPATADDFARPVRLASLTAAMRTALRNHERSEDARFGVGPLIFDPADRMLSGPATAPVRVTDKEAAILRYLHRAGTRPVPREELLDEVWGYNSGVTTHTLETHIYRLRQKIEPEQGTARLLITEDGGYRLAPPEDQSAN